MPTHESHQDDTGVLDVRVVRDAIAEKHGGNIEDHVSETIRIAQKLQGKLQLGPTIAPPPRSATARKSGT
jgi:hypothetical protein